MKKENIVGKRIGLFDVLYECDFKSNDGHRMFHVKCSECGWETNTRMDMIAYAKKCKHIDNAGRYIDRSLRWSNKKLRDIFNGMKTRCYDQNNKDFRWYGNKNITICKEWLNNPIAFEEWSLRNGYKNGLTIDRIEEKGEYSPTNCRWVSNITNAKYKSTTREIVVDGTFHTGRDWSNVLNLGTNTINRMLRQNTEEQVIEFIRQRLQCPNKTRKGNQSWMGVYGID